MGHLRKLRRHSSKSGRLPVKASGADGPERIELEMSELEAILERSKTEPLGEEDCDKLHGALETLLFLTQELEKNRVSIQRLKQLLFGAATEKTRNVLQKALQQAGADTSPGDEKSSESEAPPPAEKAKGHGRHGAQEYTGGTKVVVKHPSLEGGDCCPHCKKGKVYERARTAQDDPGQLSDAWTATFCGGGGELPG